MAVLALVPWGPLDRYINTDGQILGTEGLAYFFDRPSKLTSNDLMVIGTCALVSGLAGFVKFTPQRAPSILWLFVEFSAAAWVGWMAMFFLAVIFHLGPQPGLKDPFAGWRFLIITVIPIGRALILLWKASHDSTVP